MKPPPGVQQDVILPEGGVIPGMFGPGPITPITGATDPAKFYALGDFRAPILKPRAAAAVKAHSDAVDAGLIVPPPASVCKTSGLFMELTDPGALKITQTATDVTLQFGSDGARRIVRMTATHDANPSPSPIGDSVGQWDGDTLVVDTVGLDDKAALDRYGTPHTAGLHVIERIRLIKGGTALEDHVFAEDKATFSAPWWGIVTFGRSNEAWTDPCEGK
jgi:hypothetical protein